MQSDAVIQTIQGILDSDAALETRLSDGLRAAIAAFDATTGTLHRADGAARTLHLVAAHGLPEHVQRITAEIPFGKGMAGLCAERGTPVTVCNLQTDDSGVARPAARETGVAGAIVVPVRTSEDAELCGTLGIGKAGAHDYSESEEAVLLACGAVFAGCL